jgi:hypothetical protein
MTINKHLKRRARLLAAATGQPYATALRSIRSQQEDRMSSIPNPEQDTALCSFCSKPEPAVQRLVAGPGGVFICDECVETSSKIIADSSPEESARSRAAYFAPSVEVALTRLGGLVRSADSVEGQFVRSVSSLRELGADWTVIATAAGTSADSIQARIERAEQPKAQ